MLPLRPEELVDGGIDLRLQGMTLKYPPSIGSNTLRDRIAMFHGAGATREQVMVTNGGSEANHMVMWGLLEPGDRVAVMIPNYLQTWGLARHYAGRADPFRLVESAASDRRRWALDVDSLNKAVGKKTRLIVVTHPNNPSGAVLSAEEIDAIVRAARRSGAFILADEIYRGAEVDGPLSPTFWGRYHRVLVTSGLSKAFGMPGLRIGWVVGPPKTIAHLCRYHDYTTLTPSLLSDHLAGLAMEPARRDAILQRTRDIIRRNLPALEGWITSHGDTFDYIRPQAGAIALLGYDLPIASEALFDRLRVRRSVLITPGAHFGIGKYIRVGYGYDMDRTLEGLRQIDPEIAALRKGAGRGRRSRRGTGRAARAGAQPQ